MNSIHKIYSGKGKNLDLLIDLSSVNAIEKIGKRESSYTYQVSFKGENSIKVCSIGLLSDYENYLEQIKEIGESDEYV